MLEIRWHGRGGQGAITVSRVLAMAALKKGLFVQSFPEYGAERGGAPMKAYNRLDTRQINLHCGVYAPDIVAVLDQTLLAAEDVTEGLKEDGTLVVNTPRSPQEIREVTGFCGRILTVDADFIARQTNKFPNVPLLGALMRAIKAAGPQPHLEDVKEALREFLAERLSESKVKLNVEALQRGYETAVESPKVQKPKARRERQVSLRGTLKSYRELPLGGVIAPENREESHTGGWRQQKPVFDETLCIHCLLCWVNCPEPAIITENQRMLGYDYRYCKGCGICFASCPVGAISMVPEAEAVPPQGRIKSLKTQESEVLIEGAHQ